MPVVADGADIVRSGRGSCSAHRRVVTHSNFIDDQGVAHSVGAPLMKNNVLQILRPKFINRAGTKIGKRNSHLNPLSSRNVSRNLSQRQRLAEGCGKFGDLESLATVGEHNQRKIVGGNRFRRVAPEIKIAPFKFRKAIAIPLHPYFRFPSSIGLGLPLQPKRIRRRQKGFSLDWEAAVFQLKKTGPIGRAGAVEISVRREAVVENDVAVILRVPPAGRAEGNYSQKEKTKGPGRANKALVGFHNVNALTFLRRPPGERAVYGRISACAGKPWAESGLIQTLTLAASAANWLRSFQIANSSGFKSNLTFFVSPGAIEIV